MLEHTLWTRLNEDYYSAKDTICDYKQILTKLTEELDNTPLTKSAYEEKAKEINGVVAQLKKDHRQEYLDRQFVLDQEFRNNCEDEFGFTHLPPKVKSKIHYLAYAEGHAYGHSEIANQYDEIVELALLCFEEARKENDSL